MIGTFEVGIQSINEFSLLQDFLIRLEAFRAGNSDISPIQAAVAANGSKNVHIAIERHNKKLEDMAAKKAAAEARKAAEKAAAAIEHTEEEDVDKTIESAIVKAVNDASEYPVKKADGTRLTVKDVTDVWVGFLRTGKLAAPKVQEILKKHNASATSIAAPESFHLIINECHEAAGLPVPTSY